jgi:hypothetical protein
MQKAKAHFQIKQLLSFLNKEIPGQNLKLKFTYNN